MPALYSTMSSLVATMHADIHYIRRLDVLKGILKRHLGIDSAGAHDLVGDTGLLDPLDGGHGPGQSLRWNFSPLPACRLPQLKQQTAWKSVQSSESTHR